MNILINQSSMLPIYEQIVSQIKTGIRKGIIAEQTVLPSVRTLAKELRISALTVKKAYDVLEEQGYTRTVHGKGTYVLPIQGEVILEEQKKELEQELEKLILKGRQSGLTNSELRSLFDLMLEE